MYEAVEMQLMVRAISNLLRGSKNCVDAIYALLLSVFKYRRTTRDYKLEKKYSGRSSQGNKGLSETIRMQNPSEKLQPLCWGIYEEDAVAENNNQALAGYSSRLLQIAN